MKQTLITFAAVYALIIGATSCGGGSNGPVAGPVSVPTQYTQIERLARPAIKEAFQAFKNHDSTNRSTPYAAPLSSQTLYQEIGTFTTTVAGRSATNAATLQKILIPDEIAVDLSQSTTTAAYLGVETGGATGNKFGGRGLTDDVIDIDLGAVFGKTLSALGLIPDDGKASPCLTTDNVPSQAVADHVSTTFPYVGTPH
jgi:hypothetical protein